MVMPMDVFEAVESRIACHWFLDKPVDATIVRDLIARAARAASGGNLQSWQVYALSGAPLAALKRKVAAHIAGEFVAMPPEQMLFCAVAIGYGDHGHPANSFRSPRAGVDEFCKFFGFE